MKTKLETYTHPALQVTSKFNSIQNYHDNRNTFPL